MLGGAGPNRFERLDLQCWVDIVKKQVAGDGAAEGDVFDGDE